MSMRLQVLLEPMEYKAFRQIAKKLGLSLGEWVRLSLRRSAKEASPQTADRKLATIRKACQFSFPSGNIEKMNAEIEKGYLS